MATDTDFETLLSAATGGSAVVKPRPSAAQRVLWLLSLVPWTTLLLLASMVIRVRLADGVWPTRNQPDPKTLGLHNTVTLGGIVFSLAAVVLVPLLTLLLFITGQRRLSVRPPLVAVAGFAAVFLILVLDPGGIGEWLAD